MSFLERIEALDLDGKPGLQWSDLELAADRAIIAAAGTDQPGRKKLRQVRRALVKALDDVIEPDNPVGEAVSDIGIRASVGIVVTLLDAFAQRRFERLRAAGEV